MAPLDQLRAGAALGFTYPGTGRPKPPSRKLGKIAGTLVR